jgi:hypothetical protein
MNGLPRHLIFVGVIAALVIAFSTAASAKTGSRWVTKAHAISGNWTVNATAVSFAQNFKTDRGPDLKVFLSKKKIQSITDRENILKYSKYLGKLRSFNGAQTYGLSNVDLSQYASVVIYCKKYTVVWGGFNVR